MNDIIIIGSGPGGYELALKASKHKLTTLLIENKKIGGTCLNEGCIPTKSFYNNAKLLQEIRKANNLGIVIDNINIDFKKIVERKNNIIKELSEGIKFLLNKEKISIINGFAQIVDKNTVKVNDEVYQGKFIVIATGSSSVILPGFEDALTSTDILNLEQLPKKLVIIGGGVIGIEFATIFNSFGIEVEVVEYADSIIPAADSEVSKRLLSFLKSKGIKFHLNSKAIKKDNDFVYIEEKGNQISIAYDKILVSIGRKPNVENIGLDEVGINYNRKGIIVDDDFQTNINNIFAIGDVIGKSMLAHYATYNGYHVLNKILNIESKINFELVPSCVFTFPEVSWIGLTEEYCKNKQIEYKIYKSLFRANGKALTMDETDGFVKIITINDEIKGVHIIGYDASNLIHEMSALMNYKIKINEFNNIIHAHPTISEIFAQCLKK